MISAAFITHWRGVVPWAGDHQVEQDLVLSRALCESLPRLPPSPKAEPLGQNTPRDGRAAPEESSLPLSHSESEGALNAVTGEDAYGSASLTGRYRIRWRASSTIRIAPRFNASPEADRTAPSRATTCAARVFSSRNRMTLATRSCVRAAISPTDARCNPSSRR